MVLTLNHTLQQVAYNALGSYRGAVVVMDPQTGAVLAEVSKPDFNPNTVDSDWDTLVNDAANSSLLNRATQGAYPPGSIFKVVDTLAYLRTHGTIDGFQYTCNGKILWMDIPFPVLQEKFTEPKILPQPLPNPVIQPLPRWGWI